MSSITFNCNLFLKLRPLASRFQGESIIVLTKLESRSFKNYLDIGESKSYFAPNLAKQNLHTAASKNFLASNISFPNQKKCLIQLDQKRYKKNRKNIKRTDEESDEESDGEDASEENPLLMDNEDDSNESTKIIDVNSLRLDSVAKAAFSKTRTAIDEFLYKGQILVNGEIVAKKSQSVSPGDEIDMTLGPDPEDHTKIIFKRATILSLPDKIEQGRIKITVTLEELSRDIEAQEKD